MALFGRMNSLAPMCFMGAATPKTAKAMIIIAVASSLCFGCPTGICWPGPSLPWFWRSSARTPSSHRPSSQGGLARLFVFGALYPLGHKALLASMMPFMPPITHGAPIAFERSNKRSRCTHCVSSEKCLWRPSLRGIKYFRPANRWRDAASRAGCFKRLRRIA